MSEVEAALRALVSRLDEIHADPAFKSVWLINQLHAGPYRGPTYVAELERARAALAVISATAPIGFGLDETGNWGREQKGTSAVEK